MIDVAVDGAPDLADDEARERWRIHSDREAAWAIRHLAAATAEVQRLTQDHADEVDALRAWLEAALAGPERDRMFFEAALVAYRIELEERDPDLPKTYKLPGGTITRRKMPDRYVITDGDAFIAWALANDRDLLKIDSRVSPLREYRTEADSALVVSPEGEIVPGVEYVVGEDAYAAKVTR